MTAVLGGPRTQCGGRIRTSPPARRRRRSSAWRASASGSPSTRPMSRSSWAGTAGRSRQSAHVDAQVAVALAAPTRRCRRHRQTEAAVAGQRVQDVHIERRGQPAITAGGQRGVTSTMRSIRCASGRPVRPDRAGRSRRARASAR
jgi:hypothetical protein